MGASIEKAYFKGELLLEIWGVTRRLMFFYKEGCVLGWNLVYVCEVAFGLPLSLVCLLVFLCMHLVYLCM